MSDFLAPFSFFSISERDRGINSQFVQQCHIIKLRKRCIFRSI